MERHTVYISKDAWRTLSHVADISGKSATDILTECVMRYAHTAASYLIKAEKKSIEDRISKIQQIEEKATREKENFS